MSHLAKHCAHAGTSQRPSPSNVCVLRWLFPLDPFPAAWRVCWLQGNLGLLFLARRHLLQHRPKQRVRSLRGQRCVCVDEANVYFCTNALSQVATLLGRVALTNSRITPEKARRPMQGNRIRRACIQGAGTSNPLVVAWWGSRSRGPLDVAYYTTLLFKEQ